MDQDGTWRDEIRALRGRLDAMDAGMRGQLEQLRVELSSLEQRLIEQEVPSTPPPLPPAAWEEAAPVVPLGSPKAPEAAPVASAVSFSDAPPLPLEIPSDAQWRLEAARAKKAAKPKDDIPFELRFGRVWLVRIGIAILITGLVLLANYAYRNWIRDLSAGVRLTALYSCAIALGWSGIWLAAKETFKRYGEVVLAGGLAFFYYCTYAAHHVARLRVIESPVLAATLLLGAAAVIAAVSWIRQARVTAVMGILLASYATMLQPLGWLSAFSNFLLAVIGIFLMLRPGWKGPGVVAMLGTYGSFFGWQILGHTADRFADQATLWFLPPIWAVFAVPGLVNRFRDTMSERGKAWFTGFNNAAFFVLFSVVWHAVYHHESYWIVPAVFGAVLIALGWAGRRLQSPVGTVHIAQGLAAFSLALLLKLDGYHLSLGLAIEVLVLSLAFLRYEKRTELVFAVICAIFSLFATFMNGRGIDLQIPVWTAAVQAILLASAGLAIRLGCDRLEEEKREVPRAMAGGMLFVSALMAIGWCVNLQTPVPVACGIGALLAYVSLRFDKQHWLPEVLGISGVFGIVSLCCVITDRGAQPIELLIALVFAGAACVIWERLLETLAASKDADFGAKACIWLWGVIAVGAFATMDERLGWNEHSDALLLAGGAVILTIAAVWLRSIRLAMCVTALHWLALFICLWGRIGRSEPLWYFLPVLSSAVMLALMCRVPAMAVPRDMPASPGLLRLLRITLFVSWVGAWMQYRPENAGDVMALSALALAFVCVRIKKPMLLEMWLLLGISLISFFAQMNPFEWDVRITNHWRGWALVATTLTMAWFGTKENNRGKSTLGLFIMPWLATGLLFLWSTQMLVIRFDWKPVAILWSLLGFALVSVGLVYRRWAFRVAGFAVLGMALLKLFFVDVWDFTAFMRVASFIILGLAMMVLGLFYHRFAPTLKRWMEEEQRVPSDQ